MTNHPDASEAYSRAGVSTAEGALFVRSIAESVRSTYNSSVLPDEGGFAGMMDASLLKDYKQPVLVSGTDGVGTKLRMASVLDRHEGVGIDLVAMCANDILVTGARALFFLDYISCGKLNRELMQTIVASICEGCKQAGAALIGGETAEHPQVMAEEEYDLAGFIVGVGEKNDMLPARDRLQEGDVVISLPSSGVHSNGFSLIRKIFLKDGLHAPDSPEDREFLREEILRPTIIYEPCLRPLLDAGEPILALAHVTGGGFYENLPRVLPAHLSVRIAREKLVTPALFTKIQERGGLSDDDMFHVFNMGLGMALYCPEEEAERLLEKVKANIGKLAVTPLGSPRIIGRLEKRSPDQASVVIE